MSVAPVKWTGVKELDAALAFLKDKSAKRIGRACSRAMAVVMAKHMRALVPSSIAASLLMGRDKGIGSRGDKAKLSNLQTAKAGVAVGKVGRAEKSLGKVVNRGKRKGVGVSSNNLRWFMAGTKDRWTGAKGIFAGKGRPRRIVKTRHPRKFTGRIDKNIWGGAVRMGAAVSRPAALAAAAKIFRTMVAKEVAACRKGVDIPLPEIDIGD